MQNLKQRVKGLLIWSQKYTQTDMVYLAKGGFWLTLGQVISTLASFLLAIAFANLLPKETYGTYKYILSLVGILGIFALPGIGTAVTQAAARGLEGSFYTGFKAKLRWGLLGSLAAVGLAGYYFFKGNYALPIPLLISAIFLPLMQASGVYGSFLTGRKLFNIQVKYSSLSQVISIGAMIAALFLTKNLFWLIAVYFVSHTFLNYFFYLLTKKKFQPNKKEDPETLSYGKRLSPLWVIGIVANQVDKILFFHFLGPIQLAIYSFALAPVEQAQSLFKSLGLLSLPKLSQRTIPELKKTLFTKILKSCLILIPIIGLYIFLAPYLYHLVFPQYTSSIIYSQVFVLSLLFGPKVLLGQTLFAHKKERELYMQSFIISGSKILLLAIFLPIYGIWGAISALLATEVISFIVLTIMFKKL